MGRKEDLDRRFEALTGGKMMVERQDGSFSEIGAGLIEPPLLENHEIALNIKAINDEMKRAAAYVAHIVEENQLMIEALKDVATAERLDWNAQQKAIGTLHTIYTKRSERE